MAEEKRLPPHNLEAEESVLGALMIDKETAFKVSDILRPDDFYRQPHVLIYEAMLELFEKREPIDVVSLSNRLKDKKQLEDIGGRSYLFSLANTVPTSGNVVYYAKIVQEKAVLRRLIGSAGKINDLGYEENEDIKVLLDQAESELFGVSQNFLKESFISVKDVLVDTFERIDKLHRDKGTLRGVPSGLADLDNLLAGFQRSDLIILAARPSMGKTSLALDFARHIAVIEKKPVAIFSLEMSREQLVDRLLCSQADVDLWKMRTGKLSTKGENSDFERIGEAMGVLSEAPIYIDDTPNLGAMEVRAKARRMKKDSDEMGLLIVDYLQLMEGRNTYRGDNRVQEVSEISRALKGIARELNVPVLALSQLSRAVEQRSPQIPQLADLRESGSIEQDADVVMFIYREEMYKKETPRRNIADILIKKHRNGPTGEIEVFFDAERVSFKNLEKKHGGDGPPLDTPPPPAASEGAGAERMNSEVEGMLENAFNNNH